MRTETLNTFRCAQCIYSSKKLLHRYYTVKCNFRNGRNFFVIKHLRLKFNGLSAQLIEWHVQFTIVLNLNL